MKSNGTQNLVNCFLKKSGRNDLPKIPVTQALPEKDRLLWCKLLLEEVLETVQACGVSVHFGATSLEHIDQLEFYPTNNFDVVETADGICDVIYVATGIASLHGLHLDPLVTEVCHNNIEKFGPGSKMREDGKVLKPPGHKPPRLGAMIEFQRKFAAAEAANKANSTLRALVDWSADNLRPDEDSNKIDLTMILHDHYPHRGDHRFEDLFWGELQSEFAKRGLYDDSEAD